MSRHMSTLVVLALLPLAGCYQQMAQHAGHKPLTKSTFFVADGRASRPLVEGTVARGQMRSDTALHQGKDEHGAYVAEFPVAMTKDVLERGKERYNIYCSVCHGLTGVGDGRIVQRGFTRPPNFATDYSRGYALKALSTKEPVPKLTDVTPGYLFSVITHGHGAMAEHASLVPVRDRWAIVGYIRALQYSQSAEYRQKLAAQKGEKK